ncbi:Arylsulphatase [Hyaloscypha variabilis]
MTFSRYGLFALATFSAVATTVNQEPLGALKQRPNIVFILTDDQDVELGSLDYMPLLHKHLINEGTLFSRHYCTTAICCPSRVTLWTGKNAHNTNVTDIFPPYGGYPKFVHEGHNENYLPVWLQAGGYNTFYTGKLFNAHTTDNYNSPYPAGWTGSDFLLDPFTYQYLNATTQRNREPPVSWEGHYTTDVIAEKAYGFIDDAVALGEPFFLTVATVAPHSNVAAFEIDLDDPLNSPLESIVGVVTPPIPAERHKHLFPEVKIPRTENFNPDKPSGASWIKALPQLNSTIITYNDAFYRARLQALQAVDELVEGVVSLLSEHGILDNTYIIYSTDNGYHISQHRLHPGKECGFEEDIHIPLIIRGPGIAAGQTSYLVSAHADLSPTILSLAGLAPRPDFDGSAIPLTSSSVLPAKESGERGEHVNIEFWGLGLPEGKYGFSLDDGKIVGFGVNNTYKALRITNPVKGYNLYYAVWCTNEHELYNLTADPGQLRNLYPGSESSSFKIVDRHEAELYRLVQRLDALLLTTKSCKGVTCRKPWSVLHPKGDVGSLAEALDVRYDALYADVTGTTSVRFDKCLMGYIKEAEGPQSLEFDFEQWAAFGGRWEL